jgi:hypothetical protein
VTAMRILLDLRRNTLELRLREAVGEPVTWESVPGTVDIGQAGRLLGVEVDLTGSPQVAVPWEEGENAFGVYDPTWRSLYVEIGEREDHNTRSASVQVRAGFDGRGSLMSVEIERRGAGYEISYPSGNQ